ncbi:MAG TPA: alpha/beta hydrolase domain-containing protein [Bryobacteraceae bacterium]|nr:alpha/beta hydrolase domain-containing protein [Bryobacteraceae bacterium]
MMRRALLLLAILCLPGFARVTRMVVESRQSPAYQGRTFGAAGAYEKLTGRVFGELDPANPLNAIVTDILLAPRNARGMVEYAATFTLLQPVDLTKASGVLIYDVPNRGNHLLLGAFQGGEPGDGFFFERGDIILASGWQGDLIPHAGTETIDVPVARNPDGSSIAAAVLARFSNLPAATKSVALPGASRRGFANSLGAATLVRQTSDDGETIPIAAGDWAFADCSQTPFPGTPNPEKLCLKDGFDPASLYQLVSTAKDPLVLGIGFAATRDIVSFFRHAAHDDAGNANPAANRVAHVIAQGTSQSGNFVKSFIHLGFNQDEQHRIVWDGANDHIAGRQVPLNIRFGVPGGAADLFESGSEGTLWWGAYTDSARGRSAGSLLARCSASHTCPKIFETFGATEFWGLRMSPGLVGTRADLDIALPSNVRRYYFPGTTHGGGRGGFALTARGAGGRCTLPDNPNPESDTMRALLDDLVAWVVKDAAPPASRYPRLSTGELAPPDARSIGFPAIPGEPLPDRLLNTFYDYDLGPQFHYADESGTIAFQPPRIKQPIPSLVPKVDGDGNEIGGVPSVLRQAPLGTYLGWNVVAAGFFKGHGCGFAGGWIPFAATRAERLAASDPRPSIEERYPTHDAYVAAVKAAAAQAVHERFLLPEDAARLIAQAESSQVR